jgi:uncharacterized FAD-dependent dehydrogenase
MATPIKRKRARTPTLAILCSHNFTEPFHEPILYAQKDRRIDQHARRWAHSCPAFGDILDGKRTWDKELARSNVRPTLPDAVAGDITAAMPYRTMTDIIAVSSKRWTMSFRALPRSETLLYSPEIKFYSTKVKMDEHLVTNVAHLYCLGDCSGWTRGLMMASVMGVVAGRQLL